MKKNNILPTIDLQNSREYSGAYNSRDFYKGTSFKMAGEWITNTHYFNDEYIVDFVSFEGALLSCIRSHTSSSLNMPELVRENDKIIGIKPNLFWAFVMAGVEGPTGKVWVPEINNGILSWKESNTPPSSTSISDLKGPAGDTPIIGIKKDTSNNHYYWTVSINEKTEWIFDDSGQRVLAEGLTGATGAPGIPGEDGEDGITPQLKIEDGYWFVSYDKNDPPKSWIKLGQAKGDKGDKGNTGATGAQGPQGPKGDSGRTPALVRKFGDTDNLTDDRILWGYLGDPTSEWVTLCYLEELRGDSIKSVNISDAEGHLELTMESSKVITSTGSVLPRFNAGTIETVEWDQNPSLVIDKTNAPREWALNVKVPKGKPATVTVVSEVEKLAPDAQPYVTDLNPDISDANLKFGIPQGEKGDPGDENIAIGCQSDFPNNEPEHDKIWYDPCDESMDEYSVQDFLYNSYIAVGGTLTQEQFETAWKSFPNTSGFEIRFANSFEELGDPTVDKLGKLYMIPATSTVLHDLFEEYIVVHSPSTTEDAYMWEKWGSGQITVDLKDYYTKSEIDQQIQKLEDKIDSLDPTASGSYESSLDPTVATVEKLGGIDAGTTVAQLTGKSYNEIFDTLIFPTVNPTFTAPSASISLKSYQNVQEIGANAPTAANFNVSFNAGAITLAGKKQNNRAGAQNMEASKILYSSSKVESLPGKVVAGAMDYYYRAAYAEGPQPKDSKGNNYQTPLAAGSVDSGKITVTGYRAAYSGLVSTASITEDVIKGLTKTTSAKKTIKVAGPISEQYICFAAPAGWSVSNIKDSNNFDVTSSYTTSTVSVTGLDGQAVDYTVYLSGKMSQPSTYYVNFN